MMLTFDACLRCSPYPDEITPADLLPPQIASETDFACYAAFAKPTWVPVLVTFAQKYRLMDGILAAIRNTLDGEFEQLLMTCRVPGVMRFPTAYGAADIFKVSDLAIETQRLSTLGIPFLTMHEGFVRHPMEQGRNEFRLQLHHPRPQALDAFAACTDALRALGLEDAPRA